MAIVNIKIDDKHELEFIEFLKSYKHNLEINEDITLTKSEIDSISNNFKNAIQFISKKDIGDNDNLTEDDNSTEKENLKIEELSEEIVDMIGDMVEDIKDDILEDYEEFQDESNFFLLGDEDNFTIMEYIIEFEVPNEDSEDPFTNVLIQFKNGRQFTCLVTTIDEVIEFVELEKSYFGNEIILKEITDKSLKFAIDNLIFNGYFYNCFEEIDDEIEDSPFHPIRMN